MTRNNAERAGIASCIAALLWALACIVYSCGAESQNPNYNREDLIVTVFWPYSVLIAFAGGIRVCFGTKPDAPSETEGDDGG